MSQRTKSELVSGQGQVFEILQALAHAVFNNGGSDESLKRLKADKQLLEAVSRQIVGPIWQYVDTVFDLEVNWNEPWEQVTASIDCHQYMSTFGDAWRRDKDESIEFQTKEKPPSRNCQYTLRHYAEPVWSTLVQRDHDCATLRELLSFARICKPFWCPSQVVAAQTILTREDHELGPSGWAPSMSTGKNEKLIVGLRNCPLSCPIGTEYFFLVRV